MEDILKRSLPLLFLILVLTLSCSLLNTLNSDATGSEAEEQIEGGKNPTEEIIPTEMPASTEVQASATQEILPTQVPTSTPLPEPTRTPEPPKITFSPGVTYVGGENLPAGLYVLYSTSPYGGNFHYEFVGTGNTISQHSSFSKHIYLEVEEGDELTFERCYAVAAEDVQPFEPVDGIYEEGMYLVGRDIPAGEYTLVYTGKSLASSMILFDDRGYFERTEDAKKGSKGILDTEVFSEDINISINEGEYIFFRLSYIEVE